MKRPGPRMPRPWLERSRPKTKICRRLKSNKPGSTPHSYIAKCKNAAAVWSSACRPTRAPSWIFSCIWRRISASCPRKSPVDRWRSTCCGLQGSRCARLRLTESTNRTTTRRLRQGRGAETDRPPGHPPGGFFVALSRRCLLVRRSLGETLFKGADGKLEIIAPLDQGPCQHWILDIRPVESAGALFLGRDLPFDQSNGADKISQYLTNHCRF